MSWVCAGPIREPTGITARYRKRFVRNRPIRRGPAVESARAWSSATLGLTASATDFVSRCTASRSSFEPSAGSGSPGARPARAAGSRAGRTRTRAAGLRAAGSTARTGRSRSDAASRRRSSRQPDVRPHRAADARGLRSSRGRRRQAVSARQTTRRRRSATPGREVAPPCSPAASSGSRERRDPSAHPARSRPGGRAARTTSDPASGGPAPLHSLP
jgi:hypothetical protein